MINKFIKLVPYDYMDKHGEMYHLSRTIILQNTNYSWKSLNMKYPSTSKRTLIAIARGCMSTNYVTIHNIHYLNSRNKQISAGLCFRVKGFLDNNYRNKNLRILNILFFLLYQGWGNGNL